MGVGGAAVRRAPPPRPHVSRALRFRLDKSAARGRIKIRGSHFIFAQFPKLSQDLPVRAALLSRRKRSAYAEIEGAVYAAILGKNR